jgi:hypothetical protein
VSRAVARRRGVARRESLLAPPASLSSPFTRAEEALVARLRTPFAVERWLRDLRYNYEKDGETLRSFRGVARDRTAHCLEAALFAAAVLEPHGFPPLLMSLESQDHLDHVIYVYERNGRYGSIGRSRDPGLHGRKPVFRSLRELALSHMDPFVDKTGRLVGWAVADLRELGRYDWRFAERNMWKVEQWLIDYPHHRVRMPERRYQVWHERYLRYIARYGRKPVYYEDRATWLWSRKVNRSF